MLDLSVGDKESDIGEETVGEVPVFVVMLDAALSVPEGKTALTLEFTSGEVDVSEYFDKLRLRTLNLRNSEKRFVSLSRDSPGVVPDARLLVAPA